MKCYRNAPQKNLGKSTVSNFNFPINHLLHRAGILTYKTGPFLVFPCREDSLEMAHVHPFSIVMLNYQMVNPIKSQKTTEKTIILFDGFSNGPNLPEHASPMASTNQSGILHPSHPAFHNSGCFSPALDTSSKRNNLRRWLQVVP